MKQHMRNMLLGIFLLVLGIWCLLFSGGSSGIFAIAGAFLPIPALIFFLSGIFPGRKPPE